MFYRLTLLCCFFVCCTVTAYAEAQKVWTVEELLNGDLDKTRPVPPIEYCQSGRWHPCVCANDVSRYAHYRPALAECGGNAAVILRGKYLDVYSVVVRDRENRDRWPTSNFGGCTKFERDTLGLNKCSAFKVQETIKRGTGKNKMKIHCLGASGYSSLFGDVVRITAKLSDTPNSNKDPLVRWCLKQPDLPLN